MNANKTFILFVNRLLNKVNITVIEGWGKASIKMPQQATCTQCQNTRMEGRKVLSTQLFCDAKHMDRVMGVKTVPETVYKEGLQGECWVPIHLWVLNTITCDHIRILFCVPHWVSWGGYKAEQSSGNVTKKNRRKD